MLRNTTAVLAAIALSTSTAFAGGLSPEIVEAPVMEVAPAPAASSINPTYVVVGVLAALLIAAAVNSNDDDDDDEVGGEVDEQDPDDEEVPDIECLISAIDLNDGGC